MARSPLGNIEPGDGPDKKRDGRSFVGDEIHSSLVDSLRSQMGLLAAKASVPPLRYE